MAGVILDAGHGGYDNGAQYDGRNPTQDKVISTSHHLKKQDLGMKVELIILSHFIEMQVQMRMNIKALKRWYLTIMGSKQRWQEM